MCINPKSEFPQKHLRDSLNNSYNRRFIKSLRIQTLNAHTHASSNAKIVVFMNFNRIKVNILDITVFTPIVILMRVMYLPSGVVNFFLL